MSGHRRGCRSIISRDYQTGSDEGQELNMAVRFISRSVWTSFSGLKLDAAVTIAKFQQGVSVPKLSALTLQSRGIRQGETCPQM